MRYTNSHYITLHGSNMALHTFLTDFLVLVTAHNVWATGHYLIYHLGMDIYLTN